MKNCPQSNGQSVYEHCISVRDHLCDLYSILQDLCEKKTHIESKYVWRLPVWLIENPELIFNNLLDIEVLIEYTEWHDLGKPFCREIDEQGKQHFLNHAAVSERIWAEAGGDPAVGKLIGMDMDIHALKAVQVPEFASRPEACSLLLVGLSEVTANSKMFGGLESTSFKIKYGQIEKRGKAILNLLKVCLCNG